MENPIPSIAENLKKSTFEETYKSQMAIAIEGLKMLAYANGGAALALMTLLGSLVGRCISVPNVAAPIVCFTAGLVASIVSFFLSYFTQMRFMMWLSTDNQIWMRYHKLMYFAAATAIIISVGLFVAGVLLAAGQFIHFTCIVPDVIR